MYRVVARGVPQRHRVSVDLTDAPLCHKVVFGGSHELGTVPLVIHGEIPNQPGVLVDLEILPVKRYRAPSVRDHLPAHIGTRLHGCRVRPCRCLLARPFGGTFGTFSVVWYLDSFTVGGTKGALLRWRSGGDRGR